MKWTDLTNDELEAFEEMAKLAETQQITLMSFLLFIEGLNIEVRRRTNGTN